MAGDDETRVAVVTGASRGIGSCVVRELAARGWRVACLSRKGIGPEDRARGAAEAALSRDFACDVADDAGLAQALKAAHGAFGRIDLLVNNAGQHDEGRSAEYATDAFERLLRVNATAVFAASREAYPYLAETRGLIVNMGSYYDKLGVRFHAAYCASKAALWMQTQALHLEEGADIDVYAASPGTVDTEMQVLIRASGVNPVSKIPRGDLAPASLPAAGMVWLLAERPNDLKGQDVNVRDAAFLKRAGIAG